MLMLMRMYNVNEVYAYNATFDRNALNKTYRYLTKSKTSVGSSHSKRKYTVYGLWRCDTIFQQKTFRKIALRECWFTPSCRFFSSNAETAYKYISFNYDFEEEHKGIDDVRIEYEILLYARRQKKKMSKKTRR